MNCKTCQKNVSLYIEGKAPEDIKIRMKTHLDECNECMSVYTAQLLTHKMILEEKAISSNPFLSTRVMRSIDILEKSKERSFFGRKALQPVFISLIALIALFIGITTGNSYSKAEIVNDLPKELVYLDDGAMESLQLFVNE